MIDLGLADPSHSWNVFGGMIRTPEMDPTSSLFTMSTGLNFNLYLVGEDSPCKEQACFINALLQGRISLLRRQLHPGCSYCRCINTRAIYRPLTAFFILQTSSCKVAYGPRCQCKNGLMIMLWWRPCPGLSYSVSHKHSRETGRDRSMTPAPGLQFGNISIHFQNEWNSHLVWFQAGALNSDFLPAISTTWTTATESNK